MRLLLLSFLSLAALAQTPVRLLLWPEGAPASEGKTGAETVRVAPGGDHVISNVHQPSITPYLPAQGTATGWGVVIAPGGGHRELWSDHEGHTVARWLSARGIAAFVLYYRLAREQGSTYKIEEHAMADTWKAIETVRAKAKEFGVSASKVGVMGFSAGGELAALAAMSDAPAGQAAPAFQALVYPAIPLVVKTGKQTPPSFLVCGENDRQNIAQGMAQLYLTLKQTGASAEFHVYSGVGHGFGLRDSLKGPVAGWLERFREWLLALPANGAQGSAD